MKEFQTHFEKLLRYMLATESPPSINHPCSCGSSDSSGTPKIRSCHCNDCMFFDPCCDTCFIERHRSSPLHWAEVWNGQFFERRDISQLGYVFTFGHDGLGGIFPNASPTMKFILVDLTGVHRTRIAFCECIGRLRDRVDLPLEAQISPATLTLPRMGFTFNLLKD